MSSVPSQSVQTPLSNPTPQAHRRARIRNLMLILLLAFLLFARFAGTLDRPPAGLDAILRDDHPAIAHFSPQQRDEVRMALAGATIRD